MEETKFWNLSCLSLSKIASKVVPKRRDELDEVKVLKGRATGFSKA